MLSLSFEETFSQQSSRIALVLVLLMSKEVVMLNLKLKVQAFSRASSLASPSLSQFCTYCISAVGCLELSPAFAQHRTWTVFQREHHMQVLFFSSHSCLFSFGYFNLQVKSLIPVYQDSYWHTAGVDRCYQWNQPDWMWSSLSLSCQLFPPFPF